ncbi:MAG: MFS transporter [Gemmatimonadetes bacterium]|nr:MFS transporter [Gemmatimonadota bacterium]
MTITAPDPRPQRLTALFFAVLLDLIGFGIILPLLPFFASDMGASGFEVGLLVMVYSAIQLVMAPTWGRLSDRLGRRPILIIGLVGSAASYALFATADSLLVLFVSRIVGGFGGSTIPVAQAYIADVTPPSKRAGSMGLIGAAFGLGFVIGPALGGILSTISYTTAGYAAAGICLLNAGLALAVLPESRRSEAPPTTPRFDLPEALRQAADSKQVRRILVVYLFLTMAFSALQPTLSLLADARFAMDARQAGYLFALLGLVSVVMQGMLVRRLVPRVGERALLRASAFPFAAGLLLVGLSASTAGLLAGLVLLGLGYGGAIPSVLGLLSRSADPDRQGAALGLGQSVGSSARVLGPLMAGGLFDLRVSLPYVVAAGLVALGLTATTHLSQPGDRPPAD